VNTISLGLQVHLGSAEKSLCHITCDLKLRNINIFGFHSLLAPKTINNGRSVDVWTPAFDSVFKAPFSTEL